MLSMGALLGWVISWESAHLFTKGKIVRRSIGWAKVDNTSNELIEGCCNIVLERDPYQ